MSEIEITFRMIQAIGCIGGTHISIKRPLGDTHLYKKTSDRLRNFNDKQFFSLNVHAICDSQDVMDSECKGPGSVHDAKDFSNSYVC